MDRIRRDGNIELNRHLPTNEEFGKLHLKIMECMEARGQETLYKEPVLLLDEKKLIDIALEQDSEESIILVHELSQSDRKISVRMYHLVFPKNKPFHVSTAHKEINLLPGERKMLDLPLDASPDRYYKYGDRAFNELIAVDAQQKKDGAHMPELPEKFPWESDAQHAERFMKTIGPYLTKEFNVRLESQITLNQYEELLEILDQLKNADAEQ